MQAILPSRISKECAGRQAVALTSRGQAFLGESIGAEDDEFGGGAGRFVAGYNDPVDARFLVMAIHAVHEFEGWLADFAGALADVVDDICQKAQEGGHSSRVERSVIASAERFALKFMRVSENQWMP